MPTTDAPSRPPPKPATGAKRGPKPGGGFKPTAESRTMVEALAMYRVPQDEMALLVINPKTKRPISEVTLRKHFAAEIDSGFAKGRMRIMAASFRSALGTQEAPGNVTAQIWLQKVLYGLREKVEVELPANAAFGTTEPTDMLEAARRLAFTLTVGAREASKSTAKPRAAAPKKAPSRLAKKAKAAA